MSTPWEGEVAGLLHDLSATQDKLFALLEEKRQLLLAGDHLGLVGLQPREQDLIDSLQACHDRRAEMLARAGGEGLPNDSITSLAQAVPCQQRDQLNSRMRDAAARASLLQHQSLANWVVTQRMLIHLSQVLEIIATGGRGQPTYNNEHAELPRAGGALVDQAA